jgi:hypothetical protein
MPGLGFELDAPLWISRLDDPVLGAIFLGKRLEPFLPLGV